MQKATEALQQVLWHDTYLSADLGWVCTQCLQHARSNTLTLTQQTQQDVLSANVVVACAAGEDRQATAGSALAAALGSSTVLGSQTLGK